MELKVSESGLLATAILAVGIVLAGGGLYTIKPAEEGVVYKLNRVTGELLRCTHEGCVEVK